MKRKQKQVLHIVTFLLIVIVGFGQENSKPDFLKELQFLEGEWSLENFETKDQKTWNSIGNSIAHVTLEHDGKFIQEKVKYITGFGEINMITYIGFDYRLGKLKLCAMDKEYGSMDIYEGDKVGDDFVFTNLKSDLAIAMQDGKKLNFKLTYATISDTGFEHWVEGTYDGGETWFPFSKSVYTKSKG
ncbi:hypothetical protein M3P19_16320 [Muricauda sp. 2012CJ35-5]|uniref:DUF1579 domain-containing protein n=1 Tax=Flagellimonas spongiicola TaxID=2942208 RepID=A0ABT0PWC7_9FLAO|nr:hypothetical protein [Allomuricauda spongiicola]MCL6275581.1 hypothetical protein [Allomuricauda spongiicola]